jgi:1-acyl-sn-glycerol-3-phosphate acyltransferase
MLGWIRFSYRLICFIISAFLLLVPLLILAKALGLSMRIRHGIFKIWRQAFLWAMGIEVRVQEGERPQEAAILMGNHRSYADILFVFSATPTIFLGKAEVKSWPIIGWAAMAVDSVFVQRSDKDSRRAARATLAQRIQKGMSPVVFPEGTTAASGLLPFNPGMFYTAAEMDLPIVPFVLNYSDPALAWVGDEKFVPHVLRMMRRPAWHVRVHIGPAFRGEDAEAMMGEVRAWMEARVNP